MTDDVRGRWMWYELLTSDPAAATRFYPATLGWATASFDGLGEPYTMWMQGEAPLGGVMALPNEAVAAGVPPHWLIYVGTPDVDRTVRDVERLGGTTMLPPTDIPSIGRIATVTDPQGAAFAVHQPPDAPGPEADPGIGQISWHELATTDAAAAREFYRALFGWEETAVHDMGPLGLYRMFGRNGRTWGGMFDKPKDMPGPPAWLIYTRVDDVGRTTSAITGAGGKILNGPMEVPGGDLIAQCIDPQGAPFAVHQKRA